MSSLRKRGFLVAAVAVLLSLGLVHGEDQHESEADTGELTQRFVDDITVLGIREDGSRYRVSQPQLLLKFSDPERGRNLDRVQEGTVWAWGEGRPIALAEVWRWKGSNAWGHVLISTTPGYVTASVDASVWKPDQPGLCFVEFADAPVPAETAEERNQQMSRLINRFSGYEMVRRHVVDLRMLPDPLHSYHEEGIEGAIFALAHNDRPGAVLFLEAVSDPIRPSYWRYAWAKSTSSPVTVELDGNEVHHVPGELNDAGNKSEPFWAFFRQSRSE